MANDIVTHNPARRAITTRAAQLITERSRPVGTEHCQGALAPTFFIVRKRGGLGSSMVLPILDYVIDLPSVFIDVGGIKSPVFAGHSTEQYAHFKSDNPDRIAHAIDHRMEFPDKVAFLDFEPVLFKRAIDESVVLADSFQCSVALLYIAAKDEQSPQFRESAMRVGARQVVVLGQAALESETRPNVVRIPSLPKELVAALQRGSSNLASELNALPGEYTKVRVANKLEEFGRALSKEMVR